MEEKGITISKIYLILYNLAQTIGWTYLGVQIIGYYTQTNDDGKSLYETLKYTLIFFQNLAVLEVLHSITGIVRSSPFITLQQVSSRVVVVCLILIPTTFAKQSIGFPMLLFGWTVTEIIRYSNYALNLINAVPYFLVWLRYSTFIVLYPIGVTGELLCMFAAFLETSKTGLWSTTMPNAFNFSFSFPYFILSVMALYIPFFPQLYLHMFSQRKKVLGKSKVA